MATTFKAHPYRHPTIGWLSDLEAMTRDDLHGYYRRYYTPDNATLVIVGDIDPDETMTRVREQFGGVPAGGALPRRRTREPEQTGERRVVIRREGTTAYFRAGFHAPAVSDPQFVPALLLDAVLTGAKGVNLWTAFRVAPPQRRARLYQAVVEQGLASSLHGAMLPTAEPYLYTLSATATQGTPLESLEAAVLAALDVVVSSGITGEELARAKRQLHAQMVFDADSVSSVAHQLGFFESIGGVDLFLDLPGRIAAATLAEVNAVAASLFAASNRTIGYFEPLPAQTPDRAPAAHEAHR